MFTELVEALTGTGLASLEVTQDRPVRACRTQLIEAARQANVRIAMKRLVEPGRPIRVEARVLNNEEAELQRQRDVIFRGVNRIRTGLEILVSGTIDITPIKDEIDDLRDISNELEEYARVLASGATG